MEQLVMRPELPLDKRFVYYLLAATGICVVPATSFFSKHFGFRLTTLERNSAKRNEIYTRVEKAIKQYVEST